jgi:D-tyrosyl-tRNA(Tyr) deacylase
VGGVRAVLQRVSHASVRWKDGEAVRCGAIGRGLVVLVGAGPEDGPAQARRLAEKVVSLRVFPDERERFDRSLSDVGGEALVVSQFTLYADLSRGRRPSFVGAGEPSAARELCGEFVARLRELGVTTRTGSFGAKMAVSLENDGPVTLVLSTDPWETRIGG